MRFFLAAVPIIAFSVAAVAADLPLVKAPIFSPRPILTWDGSYVGVLGGVAHHEAAVDPNCAANIGCGTIARMGTGGTVGVLLGHNWQQGSQRRPSTPTSSCHR
jgi:hypothetical protein